MCKKLIFLVYLILPVLFTAALHAQKHCDLAINILTPVSGTVIPFGDSAYLSYSITNLGPDTLEETDTFYFRVLNISLGTLPFSLHLSPGSTSIDTLFYTWHEGNDNEDIELSTCLILRPALYTSITDTVEANDTSCTTFILKGPTVGMDHISKPGNVTLQLHPNPATSAVFITLPEKYTPLPRIEVYDLTGRLIRQEAPVSRSSGQEIRVDISGLHRGIYLLKMYSGEQAAYGKLVVQ